MASRLCRFASYGRGRSRLLSRFGPAASSPSSCPVVEDLRVSDCLRQSFHSGTFTMAEKEEADQHISDMRSLHKPDGLERWILAKYSKKGQYKSKEDVPTRVPHGEMDAAKTRFRIQMSLYMMLATILACGVMVYLGKNLSQKDSLETVNMDRHRKWKEEAEKKG